MFPILPKSEEEDLNESQPPSPMQFIDVVAEESEVVPTISVSSEVMKQEAPKDVPAEDESLQYVEVMTLLSAKPSLADSVRKALVEKPQTNDKSTQTPKMIGGPRKMQKTSKKSSDDKETPCLKKSEDPKGKLIPETKKTTGSEEKTEDRVTITVIPTTLLMDKSFLKTVTTGTVTAVTATCTITGPLQQIIQRSSSSGLPPLQPLPPLPPLPPLRRIGTDEIINIRRNLKRKAAEIQGAGNAASGQVRSAPIAPKRPVNLPPTNMRPFQFDQVRQATPPAVLHQATRFAMVDNGVGYNSLQQHQANFRPMQSAGTNAQMPKAYTPMVSSNYAQPLVLISQSNRQNLTEQPSHSGVKTYGRSNVLQPLNLIGAPTTSGGAQQNILQAKPSHIKPTKNQRPFFKQVLEKEEENPREVVVKILTSLNEEDIGNVQNVLRRLGIRSTSQETAGRSADENRPPHESKFGTDDAPNNNGE